MGFRSLRSVESVKGVKAWHLFRDWERLWLRASDYKNHRVFTLRCIHKDLIPVSIKLKSTIKQLKPGKLLGRQKKIYFRQG